MSDPASNATETSPLITITTDNTHYTNSQQSYGSADTTESTTDDATVVSSVDGHLTRGDENGESHEDDTDGKSKQYTGLPEVRARMKYMFPALAIGVFLAAADQTIIVSSYGKIGSELSALNKTSWVATA